MIRRILPLVLLAAASTLGCRREEPPPPPANLTQPAAAVVVNDRLFVASSVDNGLRVARLAGAIGGSCSVDADCAGGYQCSDSTCVLSSDAFVRAPNPLFALAVPAVRRPDDLVGLEGEGRRPLVVVVSSVDRQLRVVDAEALVAIGAPLALPGRPVALAASLGGDGVVVAVDAPEELGSAGAVVVVSLSPAALAEGPTPSGDVATVEEVWPVDAVPAGLAVSAATPAPTAWVSDARSATVAAVDLVAGGVTMVDCGLSLGRLVASPATEDEDGTPLVAGRYVYGLTLDGDSIIAIDSAAMAVAAPQQDGGRILPLDLPLKGASLAAVDRILIDYTTVDADGNAQLRSPVVPVLLAVPMVAGGVVFLHGTRMVPVDSDGDFLPLPRLDGISPTLDDSTAPRLVTEPDDEDPSVLVPRIETTPGVTRTRTWRITRQGPIPRQSQVLGVVVHAAGAVRMRPTTALPDLETRVQPGDILELVSHDPVAGGCANLHGAEYEIDSVDGSAGELTFVRGASGDPLPTEGCFTSPVVYRVRAPEFLVSATAVSEVLRLAAGETLVYQGERFVVTDPSTDGPELSFELDADQSGVERDAQRSMLVRSGLDPLPVSTDVSGFRVSRPVLPGTPAVRKTAPGQPSTGGLYIPYAGSGYLLRFDLRTAGDLAVIR